MCLLAIMRKEFIHIRRDSRTLAIIFPVSAMPKVLQWFRKCVPLTYFLVIDRGIVLKGNSMDVLMPQVVALAIFGAVILVLAAVRFRKRLE